MIILKCPRCGKEPANIDPTFGVLPGDKCQTEDAALDSPTTPEFYNLSKQHRVQEQRDAHGRDLIQPFIGKKGDQPNPDFVKAYPDKAKDYFTPEQLKKV